MKYLLFISFFLMVFSHFSKAQFNKHDVSLGLLFQPYHNEYDSPIFPDYSFLHTVNRGFDIGPSAGWFITDNVELGVGAGVSWYKDYYRFDSITERHAEGRSVNFTVYGRRYFPLNDKVALIISGAVHYARGITQSDLIYYVPASENHTDYNTEDYSIGFSPGLSFCPVKKIQLITSFGSLYYNKSIMHSKIDNSDSVNRNYGLNFSLNSFSFGIHYIL